GNHDYQLHPYYLYFEIDAGPTQALKKIVQKYDMYNLNLSDAKAIQGGSILVVDTNESLRMVDSVGAPIPFYTRRITRDREYVIRLGNHRIVMLDTGPNADVIGSVWDVVQEKLGMSNEDEKTFVRGLPNSAGHSVAALTTALQAAPADAVFIVGMHNPP